MNKSSEFTEEKVEEMVSMVEKLGSLLRGILGAKKEEIPSGVAGFAEEPVKAETVEVNGQAKPNKSNLVREFLKKHGKEVRNKDVVEAIKKDHGVDVAPSLVSLLKGRSDETKAKVAPKKDEETKASTSRVVSGSAIIREYLEENGLESPNDEVVKFVKKSKGLNVRPTLVSSVRAILKKKGMKTTRMKRAEKVKTKSGRGPTMPSVVIDTLKKAGKEGMELSEITQKVLKSDYEYKGSKDIHGLAQNVYQALHNLSKKIAHPGFKGNTPVVIHEKTPGQRGGRYKLNPKAKVA